MLISKGTPASVFQNNGSGGVKVIQENSYYAFGLTLANSPISMPTVPNKQLFNGGSEWQNDYSNLPDYYQTFYRNYDAALGRFIGVDPKAESAETMTAYQFAGNNPIMNNDPQGSIIHKSIDIYDFLNNVDSYPNGASWTADDGDGNDGVGEANIFVSMEEAIDNNQRGGNYTVNAKGYFTDNQTLAYGKQDLLTASSTNSTLNIDHGILESTTTYHVAGDEVTFFAVNNNIEAYNIFSFLAENTDVEWGRISFGTNNNYISTSHSDGHEYFSVAESINLEKNGAIITEIDHSHPTPEDIAGPSGCFLNDQITIDAAAKGKLGGDIGAANKIINLTCLAIKINVKKSRV